MTPVAQLAGELATSPCKRVRILTSNIDDRVACALAAALGQLPITETIYIVTRKPLFAWWSNLLRVHGGMAIGSGRYHLVTADALRIEFERVGYIHTVVFDRINAGPKTAIAAALIADRSLRVWIWGPNPATKYMRQAYQQMGLSRVSGPLP